MQRRGKGRGSFRNFDFDMIVFNYFSVGIPMYLAHEMYAAENRPAVNGYPDKVALPGQAQTRIVVIRSHSERFRLDLLTPIV
jgi:hypothetical protein